MRKIRFLGPDGEVLLEKAAEDNIEFEKRLDVFDDKGQHVFKFARVLTSLQGEAVYEYELDVFVPWPEKPELARC